MYAKITTRCNMHCEHCCYSCTAHGEDMSLDVYRAVLKYCQDYGDILSLGGGEPTIHPLFWQFLGEALGAIEDEHLWLATNGSIPEIAIPLARMARKGVLGVDLSMDAFHDDISEEVVRAFTPRDKFPHDGNDMRNIRDVTLKGTRDPILAGRCDWGTEGCVCEDLVVVPDGRVYECGCADAPLLGHIQGGFDRPEDYEGECWKAARKEDKKCA